MTFRKTAVRPFAAASGSRSTRAMCLPANTGESISVSTLTGLNSVVAPFCAAAWSALANFQPSGRRRLGLMTMRLSR